MKDYCAIHSQYYNEYCVYCGNNLQYTISSTAEPTDTCPTKEPECTIERPDGTKLMTCSYSFETGECVSCGKKITNKQSACSDLYPCNQLAHNHPKPTNRLEDIRTVLEYHKGEMYKIETEELKYLVSEIDRLKKVLEEIAENHDNCVCNDKSPGELAKEALKDND